MNERMQFKMAKRLTRLRIDEVSSVDRGAGEGVKIMLMKRQEEPQMTQPNTISKIFAKMFGAPDNSITIDKSIEGLAESVSSILADENIDHATELGKAFQQFGDHLKSNLSAVPAVTKKEEPTMDMKALAKAFGLPETATEAEITKAITDQANAISAFTTDMKKMKQQLTVEKAQFTDVELDFYTKASKEGEEETPAAKAFREASHTERGSIMKSAEPALPSHIQKIFDDNAAMAKRLADLEAGGSLAAVTKQAVDAGLPESEGATVQAALKGDKTAVEKLLGFIKTAQAAAEVGGVFKEFGASHNTTAVGTGKAYDELVAKATELRKSEPKLTPAAAFAKVYEDPANIEIVRRERGENRPN